MTPGQNYFPNCVSGWLHMGRGLSRVLLWMCVQSALDLTVK